MIHSQRMINSLALLSALLIASIVAPPARGQAEMPLTTKSDQAKQYFNEGQQFADELRFPEAREAFGKAIQADPNFAMAHLQRGWVGASNEEFFTHVGHAVDLAEHASAGERLAIMALKANADNDFPKSIELQKQLAEMYPNDKRVHLRLAIYYQGQDMDKKAIGELEKATKIDPEWAPPYNLLGYQYRNAGAYDKAEATFKKYVSLRPDEPNPYDSLADLYTKMGRYEEAIQNYQKAVEIGKFPMSQRKIGDDYVFMGQFAKGREAYEAALKMEDAAGGKVTDLTRIAYSYLLEGKTQEALTASDRALELARESGLPDREAGIYNGLRSEVYVMLGDLDAAEQSVQKSRSIIEQANVDPSVREGFERWTVWREGVLAAKRGNTARAEAKIDQYYTLMDADKDVNQQEAYHALVGLVKLEAGDYRAAVEELKKANQDDPYIVYHLALAESRAGNAKEATELLTKVSGWNENGLGYATVKVRADNDLDKMRAGLPEH